MGHEIQLDGTEVTVIKALGLSGGDVTGRSVIERCQNLGYGEVASAIKGLMSVGYVDGDSMSFRKQDEFEDLKFRVNSGWSKELREAIDPQPKPQKSKRVRRE